MALSPKAKLWVGIGVFTLIVLGLLSLSSDTFSGNLSLVISTGNPEICGQLKTACDTNGEGSPACDNFKKLMCQETLADAEKVAQEQAAQDAAAAANAPAEEPRARPRVPTRGAAPSPSDSGAGATTQTAPSSAELDQLLNEFPESPSQGSVDTSTLR